MNPGLPTKSADATAAKRKRAELVANLQWLCRLFLETREQLFATHEGTASEAFVCDGLREEMDAIRFRRMLEDALQHPEEPRPVHALVKMFRSFGRKVLHGRTRGYCLRAHEQFATSCAGHNNGQSFVLAAVPRVLKLFDRLVEETRRGSAPASPSSQAGSPTGAGKDPWVDSGREDGTVGWEVLDHLLEQHNIAANLAHLHEEADDYLQQAALGPAGAPAPLQLPADGDRLGAGGRGSPGGSGGRAPRGRGMRRPGPAADAAGESVAAAPQQRQVAQAPYYSGDPAVIAKVAKAPLPNLDSLIMTLAPGAELTTEGLLLQLADEELLMLAYALEQINEAAGKRLVRELEARDELRSSCMHRREYLSLLDGALGQRA